MSKMKLLLALLIASGSGVLSFLMIRSPQEMGAGAILLFPGAVAIITSGNVHDFRAWVVALGNFAFYFGVVYLVWEICERYAGRAGLGKD
jgi:hypothetical protein